MGHLPVHKLLQNAGKERKVEVGRQEGVHRVPWSTAEQLPVLGGPGLAPAWGRGLQPAVLEAVAELCSLVLDLGLLGFQRQVLQEKRASDEETRLQQGGHVNGQCSPPSGPRVLTGHCASQEMIWQAEAPKSPGLTQAQSSPRPGPPC